MSQTLCQNCGRGFLQHRAGPENAAACPANRPGEFHLTMKFKTESASSPKVVDDLARVIDHLSRETASPAGTLYYVEWVSLRTCQGGRDDGGPMPWPEALARYEELQESYRGWLHHRIVPVR